MTLQDDLARPWFEPAVPPAQAHKTAAPSDFASMSPRFAGELPLNATATPAHPEPSQLEVTQPFLPAIRDKAPDFARLLTEEPPARTPAPKLGAPVAPPAPSEQPTGPMPATPAPAQTTAPAPPAPPARAPKKRSLARRVVRRIIGPDLLRKDPKPKKK